MRRPPIAPFAPEPERAPVTRDLRAAAAASAGDPLSTSAWRDTVRTARLGGDTERLLLVGLARRLPSPLSSAARADAIEIVAGVHDPTKRALAWLALDLATPLGPRRRAAAWAQARRIPDASLRIMTLAHWAGRRA